MEGWWWWWWCSRASQKACAQASNFHVSVDDAQPPRRSEVTYKILSTYLPTYTLLTRLMEQSVNLESVRSAEGLAWTNVWPSALNTSTKSLFRLSYYPHTWHNDRRLSKEDRERGKSSAFSCFQCKCSSSFHSSPDIRLIKSSNSINLTALKRGFHLWSYDISKSLERPFNDNSRRLPTCLPSFGAEGHARTQTNNLSIDDAHRNSTH